MTKFVYDVNVESHINFWKLTIKVCDSFWWLLTVHFPTYLKGISNGGYINATYIYRYGHIYIYKWNDFTAEIDQDFIHLERREAKSR